jgi:hypothetical protein
LNELGPDPGVQATTKNAISAVRVVRQDGGSRNSTKKSMQIRFRNDPSSIDMCEREALCHERRQSQQFIGNSLHLRCDECMLTSVGMRQVQHAQPNGADTVYGPVELLYEQPASPFEIYQAMNPSRSDLKQRITENNIASAEAASPHDDFDDDDFLSNPADIPVDPNSEVHQSE